MVKETQEDAGVVSPESKGPRGDDANEDLNDLFVEPPYRGILKEEDKSFIYGVVYERVTPIMGVLKKQMQDLQKKIQVQEGLMHKDAESMSLMREEMATAEEKILSLKECIRKEKITASNKISSFKDKKIWKWNPSIR